MHGSNTKSSAVPGAARRSRSRWISLASSLWRCRSIRPRSNWKRRSAAAPPGSSGTTAPPPRPRRLAGLSVESLSPTSGAPCASRSTSPTIPGLGSGSIIGSSTSMSRAICAGKNALTKVRAAFEAWYRERAAMKLPPRVERIASHLGVQPKEVLIRNQRRRWASCAPDGTLRFNWRAIMVPPALLDYVVAHELAHLRVRSHTSEYWSVVAQAIPDYRLRRQRLREVGPLLSI